MKHVAWFTPLPPIHSDIARHNAELLPLLAKTHRIDVFLDSLGATPLNGVAGIFNAHDFVWKHNQKPYDLVVYQLGTSIHHDYMWPYLVNYPGLVTLHDGQLHHSRRRALLKANRANDYRLEFAYNHPTTDGGIAELGISGSPWSQDYLWTGSLGSLNYLWPMRRVVLDSARVVLVHNSWLAEELQEESPRTPVASVEMGVPSLRPVNENGQSIRQRHRVPDEVTLFATIGDLTPEKRISETLKALAALKSEISPWHLLLCGQTVDHYDAQAEAQRLGITEKVSIVDNITDEELSSLISAADVCVCLRWPPCREASASWLRCLSAGKPTVITDLIHTSDVPSLDPRNWMEVGERPGRTSQGLSTEAACVSIDILDEHHSLTLALARLAVDSNLRTSLGSAARRLWSDRFTLERMATDYEMAMVAALETPYDRDRQSNLPPHLRQDGTETLRTLLQDFGISSNTLLGR